MCKLATTTGKPLRTEYSDFEIRAAKYAVENNINKGETFTFGNAGEEFSVTENNETGIVIVRLKDYNNIEFVKVQPAKKVEQKQIALSDSQPTITVESKPTTTTSAKAEVVNTVSQAVLTALNGLNIGGGVDEAAVNALIDKKINALKDAHTTRIQINEAPAVKIDGVKHQCFDDVLMWCTNRTPVYLFGPSGTGKSYLCEQVAKALGLEFYTDACLQQKFELVGFIDAGGKYQETPFYKAFTEGGVYLLDEIDGTAPDVLVAINQVRSRMCNFPGKGLVKAHKDFVFIAAGNTVGRGKTEAYNGRYQLDASTLDGFAFIGVDYDRKIELALTGNNKELVDFAHALRKAIKTQELTYTFSPRALKRFVIAEGANMDPVKVMKQSLCAGWAKEDIILLSENIDKKNKYAKVFAKIATENE